MSLFQKSVGVPKKSLFFFLTNIRKDSFLFNLLEHFGGVILNLERSHWKIYQTSGQGQ